MKWFPTRVFRTPPVYSLPEWELVQVPFPGTYVVAYFDDDYRLLGLPTFQVDISIATRLFSWSSGDDQMALDPRKLLF